MIGVEMSLAALMISLMRGTPSVTFMEATPAKWKVLSVICVAGSPNECAATAPTASPGCMTGRSFPIDRDYLDHGIHIARESARLDIGQGCVVRKGTVLAVEAFEGTDELFRRAGGFKTDESLFVKTVKTRQDWRFDVPCFGLKTLETMREAGLATAALEAGKVLILDKPAVVAQARTWGISLLGF
jgi:DUF1009 family protein